MIIENIYLTHFSRQKRNFTYGYVPTYVCARMDAVVFSFYQMIKRMVFDEWKKLKTKKKRLHGDEIRKFPVKVRRRVAGVFGTGIITFTQFNNNNNVYAHNIMTGRLNPLTAQPLSVGRLYAGTSYTSYMYKYNILCRSADKLYIYLLAENGGAL